MIFKRNTGISKYFLILVFSLGLFFSYYAANNILLTKISATVNDPYQISNDMVNDNYLTYIKEKVDKGSNSDCQKGTGVGVLEGDDVICNPGLENLQDKAQTDDEIVDKLSKNIDKDKQVLADKFEKLRERMEKAISEEEEEGIILPEETQKKIDADDLQTTEIHKSKEGEQCRSGDVLEGASNAEDLKVLAECQDAIGDVMHTKKMDDGDYKFLLKLDDQYEFLKNDINAEKTDGFLVIEVVPKDQDLQNIYLPQSGDKVQVWGAWVTDEPKGWHEIHPTWQVVKQ
ncbi:MAG: hypothetical protein QOK59_08480 [Nitrososphaeraceae archaeon]|jgi:hypothetical protein|nr:hypothetical protein [Nitrososphaeraceae archaeon]MDW0148704.1 hypothetical protein [Nitrososphaeraceae archaeon]MDW0153557.1 hypothetical protein [Nitrososphaeraceae archaeon]